MENNCCHRKKVRSQDELKKLTNRLSRIEGQIRGIRAMVEGDAYCIDVLMQVSAATSALSAFRRELLSEHIRTCVANDIKQGNTEKTEELVAALDRIIK
ncbi:MAG: metal-sensing transcriptional repressor [Clostridia bacterium]|nr:metal-sensing transcriptional repressor [Clostridia bacterium]